MILACRQTVYACCSFRSVNSFPWFFSFWSNFLSDVVRMATASPLPLLSLPNPLFVFIFWSSCGKPVQQESQACGLVGNVLLVYVWILMCYLFPNYPVLHITLGMIASEVDSMLFTLTHKVVTNCCSGGLFHNIFQWYTKNEHKFRRMPWNRIF